ncbi:MAG TPA: hypothetical protein DCE78_11105 [Bacteroidetes bacterium]|nr:hypothetical protein [Bacteroidota bacterium]
MKYSYQIIEGTEIQPDELKIARAKSLALAIQQHSYCIEGTLVCRRRTDNSEVILVTLDIEIPQYPANGIQVYEDVAIICSESDNNFPEVYALREDFEQSLPHTNLCAFEHPIALCVTEQSFTEAKLKLTEFEFIGYIRNWFTLTSLDKLHQEDQPLEPFFIPKGYVMLTHLYDPEKYTHLNRIGETNLYELSNEPSGHSSFHLFGFKSDPQTHGFIRRQPKVLSDIGEIIQIDGIAFPVVLRRILNARFKEFLQNQSLIKRKLAFHCCIPVKRHTNDADPCSWEYLFFLTEASILDLGEKSGCLSQIDGLIVPIIIGDFEQEVIDNIPIELYSSILDYNPSTSALFNNIKKNDDAFVLIGAGALGSQVFDHFVRMGFGTWTIIDHDNLYPHNLAKHSLDRKSVGYNKAIKVSEKANELHRMEIASPIDSDFLTIKKDDSVITKLQDAKAIIDMSTSIAVARTLARDYNDTIKTPRISSFLNPDGTDLVVLAEDKRRKFRLDFLELQYYRCLFHDESLHDHLKYDDSLKLRYNRNSCREITNRINKTDVALNASICTKSLKSIIENGEPTISIWRTDKTTFEVRKYSFEPTKWIRKDVGEWTIHFDLWLLDRMNSFRYSKLPNETGGILIGSYDLSRKVIYVCDTLFAPADSKENRSTFERGAEGLLTEYNKYLKVVDNQLCYLGEWHSHPQGFSTEPSTDDFNLYDYLYKRMSRQGSPVLMGILGDDDCNLIFRPCPT